MKVLKDIRDGYVLWHANRLKLPIFVPSNIVRKKVMFSGRVQNVGFRLELFRIAQRLKLTGCVRNLADGSVEAELQGEDSKVDFLISSMQRLKRASVTKCTITIAPLRGDEEEMKIIP